MRTLAAKLSFAFLSVSLTGIALVALFAGIIVRAESNSFLNAFNQEAILNRLADYYAANNGWQSTAQQVDSSPLPQLEWGRGYFVTDVSGQIVIPAPLFGNNMQIPSQQLRRAVPIQVDGEIVGYFLGREPPPNAHNSFDLDRAQFDFLRRVNQTLILAALGAAGISLIMGVLLARSLTHPLQELTHATRAVAQGDLTLQVPVRSQDELGELAASFNQMNTQLARARDQRQQMTADIAHDLRTPLSIILGHSEALHEGILPPTPDTFYIIHDEAKRLSRLVEELRTLSLAEAGELPMSPRPVSPAALLERAFIAYTPQAQKQAISLTLQAPPDLPEVNADPDRLAQVLDNLLNNALRFTPAGSQITLGAAAAEQAVHLWVQDSGPGIPAAELEHVFNRFYRGDKARQRQEGGSGLGLAIARSIIENHHGRIWAASAAGQGATFTIELPLAAA
ncbi:MAG: ATP-binding protein [Candidatus Promineifilaceae bacterium]